MVEYMLIICVQAEEAKVKILEVSGERVDNKSKLEVIKQEEEIIQREKQELQKEEAKKAKAAEVAAAAEVSSWMKLLVIILFQFSSRCISFRRT